jgi:hypothetical protein
MKKLIYSFILFLCLSTDLSCKKDFLDVPDTSILLRQAYIKDLKSLGEYLNGIYTRLPVFFDGYNLIYPELIADNIRPVNGNPVLLVTHYNWQQKANNERQGTIRTATVNMNPLYSTGYIIAASCNFVLEEVDKYRSQDPTRADDYKGQALGLRALVHFYMVNIFAQPYTFTTGGTHEGIYYKTSPDYNAPVQRISVADVYTNLLSDLENAIRLMPASPTNANQNDRSLVFNLNAAKALLARVQLFKGDYGAAKKWAREVVNAVPLMTTPQYPLKLFTLQETEALFQLPPAWLGAGAGNYTYNMEGMYLNSGENTRFLATTEIAGLLTADPADVRKNWISSGGSGKDSVHKFPVNQVSGFPTPANSYYQTLLRSSESCLIAAEAYAKSGNEDSAKVFLDAVRRRANATLGPIAASGTALLDSIDKERRKEMAFEGLRMFDLLRNKKGVTRVDATNPSSASMPFPCDKAIAPLPTSEILVSGLNQNPSY